MFLYFLGKCPVVQLLDHRYAGPYFYLFEETPHCFPQWQHQFEFPQTVHKCFFFSISSPTPVVSCVVDFSHSDRCKMIFYCTFDLHFPDDKWWWASFHVSVGQLYIFFGEMSVHVFARFKLNYLFFQCWVLEVLYIFWTLTLHWIDHFANISSHSVGCLLVLLIVSFTEQKLFIFYYFIIIF